MCNKKFIESGKAREVEYEVNFEALEKEKIVIK